MAAFLSRLSVHERASEAMVGLLVALAARGTARISTQHMAMLALGTTMVAVVLLLGG